MAVWYLDNDDEITDAVARLRGTDDERVVFVVPPGSRIATGRINFKLLAREAETRGMSLAVASPDEQVRAMAVSAGVLARATPDAAQAALLNGDEPPAVDAPVTAAATAESRSSSAAAATGGTLVWRSQRLRVATVLVLAAVLVAGFLLTQVLPTAEVTLTPRLVALGPLEVTVTASTETEEPDAVAGAIPAVALSIPLSVEDEYRASGARTIETMAIGEVIFSALEQEFDQEIAAGTRVHTPAGIEFRTSETVVLPRTEDGTPATVVAAIEALVSGEAGNVPAEAISVVPSLESQGIAVSNPAATTGGRFLEQPVVTAADYDAAAVDLRNRLAGALAAYLRDPQNEPAGQTVFSETASLGQLVLEPPADSVVGSTTGTFALAGSVAAEVLAVDEALVEQVTRARLQAAVPDATDLLAESVSVAHEEGIVDGSSIHFRGLASGNAAPVIDVEELAARIAGLPVSEAQAILDGLGTATVNVWPGFLGDLPNDRQRIRLDVTEASTTE